MAKNKAAQAAGRCGGKKGGDARAAALSPERRSEIAQLAADARWAGHAAPARAPSIKAQLARVVAERDAWKALAVARGKYTEPFPPPADMMHALSMLEALGVNWAVPASRRAVAGAPAPMVDLRSVVGARLALNKCGSHITVTRDGNTLRVTSTGNDRLMVMPVSPNTIKIHGMIK